MSWYRVVLWIFGIFFFLFVLLVGINRFLVVDNLQTLSFDITTQDDKIMQGLWFEEHNDYNNSYKVFRDLHRDTKSNAYLLESIRLSLLAGQRLNESEIELEALHKHYPKDITALRLLMTLHSIQKKFDKANMEAEEIIKLSKDPEDIGMVADVLVYINNPNRALNILSKLYNETQSEDVVLRMATILNDIYNEKQQAILLLEEHDKVYGGSDELYAKLKEIKIKKER